MKLAALGLIAGMILAGPAIADNGGRTDVDVECHCSDPSGQKFCADFKNKIANSPGYRLTSSTAKGYGIGVHFSCIDLWQGIDNQLAGSMAAVSVAFTIYAENLPGEVYEDSSVFRVGKNAGDEMSQKIIAALGQLVSVNSTFFQRERVASQKPAAAPSPFVYPPPSP